MLSLLALAFATPPPVEGPTCLVEPDKARWKTLRDLGRAEVRESRRRGALPGNKYRRAQVQEYIDNGWICSADDAFHASQSLLRTLDRADRLLAYHYLGWAYAEGREDAGPLAAAAYDQYLTGAGLPQWFGSQTEVTGASVCLHPIDPAATDAQRQALGARSLQAVIGDVYRLAERPLPSEASLASLAGAKMICTSERTLGPPG